MQKPISREEIAMLLQEEMKELDSEINRWSNSVNVNVTKLNSENSAPIVNFFAKCSCSVCGKPRYFMRVDDLQYEQSQMIKSAQLLNSVCGFSPDLKLIEDLKVKITAEKDDKTKEDLIRQLQKEENFYHVKFLCIDCALEFQDNFKQIFNNKISKVGVKCFL